MRPQLSRALTDRASLAIAATLAAVFLGALDQTVIVTVLPAVVVDLQIPFDRIDQAAWVVSGYLLGYTVALPLMGRFSDLRGRRVTLTIALVAFALGSAGCAAAGSLVILIVARVFQAAGGGALLPVAIAAVSDRYTSSRRAIAIGFVGAIAEAGGVLGPLYGAAVVGSLTWRWIFWLNIPLAIILLLAIRLGPEEAPRSPGRLDLAGSTTVAISLACLIVGLSHEAVNVAGLDLRPILVGVAVAAIAGFLWIELHVAHPLVDLRQLRHHGFAATIVGGMILGIALIASMVDVPLYAATVRGASASDGGLLLMRLTVFIPIGAILGGIVSSRRGLPLPTAAGFLTAGVGLALMSTWGIAPTENQLWISLGLTGLGFGLLIAALSTAAVTYGGAGREGTAAALLTVARLLGMTLGLSTLTAWGLRRFDDLAGAIPLPLPQVGETTLALQQRIAQYNLALSEAGGEVYREIFLAAAAVSLLGITVALRLRSTEGKNGSAR